MAADESREVKEEIGEAHKWPILMEESESSYKEPKTRLLSRSWGGVAWCGRGEG